MPAKHAALQIKDEVYRQMFRLEECRPGAELGLAIALLRAWVATQPGRAPAADQDWLGKVLPICLRMIETATKAPAKDVCAQ